ncbi:MAG: S41 family peptidase, partial [Ignavibacteriae bacterium]|nr:S41 family peptidase [Ignavibacteriota bacterium]
QVTYDIYDRINRNMDIFGKIYKEIALNYVDRIDADKFFEAGIEGMLKTLDPYTVYYNDKNQDALELITSGKYGGIGISISINDTAVVVTDVMQGYEAERKGLRPGDVLKQIDGVELKGMKIEDIRRRVRGQAGTKININAEREGIPLNFNLTRQEIILKSVSYEGFLGNPEEGIAYIRLDRFSNISENEVANAIKTLKSKNELKGLILDLRGNGGGLLESAIGILNKLVEKNSLLLTTRGNTKDTEKKFFSKEDPLVSAEVPVVILINGGTASASEIVAGAVQDLDRGVIIGSKSFGKGLVQQIKDLDYNSRLKITNARYFTPSGRWIQEKNYFEENKSGVFLIPESFKQKEFKTLGGRTVYANGGISPDIEVKTEPESEIHFALLMKDMFFKYATAYLAKNPGLKVYRAPGNVSEDFKNFVTASGFLYRSEADKKVDELKKIAQKKNYSEKYTEYLNKIEGELSREKDIEMDRATDEIKKSIATEINKMLVAEKEQIEEGFSSDVQLQEAIRIIKDNSRYKGILSVKF